jgi:hypothetical protein
VFGLENVLDLLIGKFFKDGGEPVGLADEHIARGPICLQQPGVPQSGHHLVHAVEGNVTAVESEQMIRLDRAGGDLGEHLFAVRTGAEHAGAGGFLAFGEFIHDVIRAPAAFGVAGTGGHHDERAEIMAERMSGHCVTVGGIDSLPAAVRFRFFRQPGLNTKPGEQSIRFDAQQKRLVHFHRVKERTVEKFHGGKREVLRLRFDGRLHFGGGRGEGANES